MVDVSKRGNKFDSMKQREQFAVSLRKEKKKEIIGAKRRKNFSKLKTAFNNDSKKASKNKLGAILQ